MEYRILTELSFEPLKPDGTPDSVHWRIFRVGELVDDRDPYYSRHFPFDWTSQGRRIEAVGTA